MQTFKLMLFDGHAIIKDANNTILIDIGAPATIHTANSLVFCSEVHTCTTDYMGIIG